MSIETQTSPISEIQAVNTANNDNDTINSNTNSNGRNTASSPSKNRRRRRRNNKNKYQNTNNSNNSNNNDNNNNNKKNKNYDNKNKNELIKSNKSNKGQQLNQQQTKIHLNKKSKKKSPWQKANNCSTFENIMNEQQNTKQASIYNNYNDPAMDEQELLEQQLILQAIAESNKLQQQQTKTNHDTNESQRINDDEKKTEMIQQKVTDIDNNNKDNNDKNKDEDEDKKEMIEKDNKLQTMSDEMLAIHLQQQEQTELLRRQKMSKIHEGKYAKVTSSSSHPTAIPKSALNFYYDDTSMMNGGLTKDEYQQKLLEKQQSSEEEIISISAKEDNDNDDSELIAISKHDSKIWSETHMNRLNEYETGGDLNTNMNIGNQAYNSFRNQLDKKGFITYHNYQLEPKDKKR